MKSKTRPTVRLGQRTVAERESLKKKLGTPSTEGGTKKVPQQFTSEPLDEHLVSFLISQGYSRPRAQQDVAKDPEGVKQLKRDYDEANKPQED